MRVELPTYAFQRERFWLTSSAGSGDVAGLGQSLAGHPLLGAMVGLADGQGWLFTGRLSLETHPWVADHVVLGVVLLPGTAYLELALHVGEQVGCGVVRELVLEAPLVLGERGAVQLQVSVGELDESSGERRSRSIRGRRALRPARMGLVGSGRVMRVACWRRRRAPTVEDRAGGVCWWCVASGGCGGGGCRSLLYPIWRRLGSIMGLLSWVCGRRGGVAMRCSPRSRCPRTSEGKLLPLGCIRRCSTRRFRWASVWSLDDAAGRGLRVPFSFGRTRLYRGGVSSLRVRMSTASAAGSDVAGSDVAGAGRCVVVGSG